jgi:hypothetical protein
MKIQFKYTNVRQWSDINILKNLLIEEKINIDEIIYNQEEAVITIYLDNINDLINKLKNNPEYQIIKNKIKIIIIL